MRKRLHVPTRPGSAAVELAVCLPLLLLILAGVWEVGRMVEVQQLLSNAVREGGRQASTGIKDVNSVKQSVVNYLALNGLSKVTSSDVTFTNLTDSSRKDPTTAIQMDHMRISVSVTYDSVRWSMLSQITPIKTLTSSADWYSMKDIPITVNTVIPVN